MKKNYLITSFITLCFGFLSYGQIVINEVDSDTDGTDVAEFIELKWTPNTALDGYVVVLFNGADDLSYDSFDLDGKSTDANGFFILANTPLAESGDIDMGASGKIQNGPDAVAVYQANGTDFPNDTPITLTNLIDVIIYDIDEADDSGLLSGFNQTVQYNEAENNASTTQSIQRLSDGSYKISNPTFRAENENSAPCVVSLTTINTTCDMETTGVDTYSVSIGFTGGNTGISYTLSSDVGTLGGDHPNTTESGTITISMINEGTNANFTLLGGTGSSCSETRTFNSPTCFPTPTCPEVGALIITEIMQNPTTPNDVGEYFEIYNTTSSSIDLLGWTLKDSSNSGEDHIIASSVVVPANGYAVLGKDSNTANNGGVSLDYAYGNGYILGNTSDDIVLDCNGSTIDAVAWDSGVTFPNPSGKSMELATNKYTASANDTGTNWAEATVEISSGGDLGTPGSTNSFVLALREAVNLDFKVYPNPIKANLFTITTSHNDPKDVCIYTVLGKEVFTQSFAGISKTFDVSSLRSGIYILKVTEANQSATKRLVIQ
ncbi:lamin tail domain-containing protein [Polaribacter sp. HL-MS24]|uniref:lamin tail domain-containing protein n=1 Tax=Polaribacter sp. HL-MS24 TaxID=3077735 RepID=UPI0029349CA6|nr:lamin tail domain-containing protein [Polaribacter sp. HL-MS24]WOC39252.1 lamin tail domain-containing protein [Polaribacter sp. HL-MS24]